MNRLRAGWGSLPILVAACAIGWGASWRLQAQPGTIGLFHDWSIAPDGRQNAALAVQMFDGWYRWALGEPVTFPTEYPVRFAVGMMGSLGLGGAFVTHLLVFLMPALAFLAAYGWLSCWSGSRAGAAAAGMFYALNPVVLNKTIAGHTSYLVGYCMLPLVMWSYDRALRGTFRAWKAASFGAFVALAAVQLQLGLVAAALSCLYALVARGTASVRRRLVVLALGFAVALLIQSPTLVGIMTGASGFEDRAQFSKSVDFLNANSIPLLDSVRLIGYLTRYDVVAITQWMLPWNIAMIVVLVGVAAGICAAPWRIRGFALAALAPAFLVMAGTKSPFGAIVRQLFLHVRYAQIFRELYHLMAIPALIYACGLAYCFRFLRGGGWRLALRCALWASIVMVSMPMLAGDGNGWMRAFDLERAYGDVLREQKTGDTRVLWLPLDQPVSFHGYGAGVDPMGVTARGSVWDYALNWPLTALDDQLHDGAPALASSLRALSVGEVVARDGMESQLARFTLAPLDADAFFSAPFSVALPRARRYRSATGYAVAHPRPFESFPTEVAFMPQRLDVIAAAVDGGYAPVAFDEPVRAARAYAVLYDPPDQAQEALELAGRAQPLPMSTIDARRGFAPSSAWWWHRRQYADVPAAAVALGAHVAQVRAPRSALRGTAVIAWIATPVGGRIRIQTGSHAFLIDTHGDGEWMSAALPLGSMTQGQVVRIASLDPGAEVAIRGFTLLDASAYQAMRERWRRLLLRATDAVPLKRMPDPVIPLRSGEGMKIGVLARGAAYRLHARGALPGQKLLDANGLVLARLPRTSFGAASVVDFTATGSAVRFAGKHRNMVWSVERLAIPALRVPHAKPVRDGERLVAWNWGYNTSWRLPGAVEHVRSALGANLFVVPVENEHVDISWGRASAFHLAYVLGCLTLLTAFGGDLLLREPAAPHVEEPS